MAIFKKKALFGEKILQNVCRYENNAYLCIRNQEISSLKYDKTTAIEQSLKC